VEDPFCNFVPVLSVIQMFPGNLIMIGNELNVLNLNNQDWLYMLNDT